MSIHDKVNLSVSRRHFLIGASLTGAGLVYRVAAVDFLGCRCRV